MSPIDYAHFTLWAVVLIFNRAAIVPLFILCIFALCFAWLDSSFAINIITAIAYFQLAPININIKSDIRYALLAFGGIYLLGAVDELLYYQLDISTVYYIYMPFIVIALNAYIAALLMRDGRRLDVGFFSALGRCLHRLRYGV